MISYVHVDLTGRTAEDPPVVEVWRGEVGTGKRRTYRNVSYESLERLAMATFLWDKDHAPGATVFGYGWAWARRAGSR